MCESEFLLVKQAAAERLGVSPDRLRVKFISELIVATKKYEFQCFYLQSLNIIPTGTVDFNDEVGLTITNPNLGVFITSFSADIESFYSGYSFEVV